MFCAILLSAALMTSGQAAPYNYQGKLVDFMPEGSTWGMPATGLPMQITISGGGSTVGPASFSLKGPKWSSSANVDLKNLVFSGGALTGNVRFKNTSGFALDGIR